MTNKTPEIIKKYEKAIQEGYKEDVGTYIELNRKVFSYYIKKMKEKAHNLLETDLEEQTRLFLMFQTDFNTFFETVKPAVVFENRHCCIGHATENYAIMAMFRSIYGMLEIGYLLEKPDIKNVVSYIVEKVCKTLDKFEQVALDADLCEYLQYGDY